MFSHTLKHRFRLAEILVCLLLLVSCGGPAPTRADSVGIKLFPTGERVSFPLDCRRTVPSPSLTVFTAALRPEELEEQISGQDFVTEVAPRSFAGQQEGLLIHVTTPQDGGGLCFIACSGGEGDQWRYTLMDLDVSCRLSEEELRGLLFPLYLLAEYEGDPVYLTVGQAFELSGGPEGAEAVLAEICAFYQTAGWYDVAKGEESSSLFLRSTPELETLTGAAISLELSLFPEGDQLFCLLTEG
ncbi:hypothetical protein [Flavonifractor sp. An100]|uniref:hypothetical protein n=1 Tax=Flavonifractor sp. An100 TaxID=1965538 RepID=UPI000B3A34EE|nr:hypothetical protein [Flavonifractor sp. An100]OUQ79503.1 hypothetical protein B5E43_06030 [Flavonifractor sp. An100]